MRNAFDFSNVTRHPVFVVTFALALPAWFIAFIAQCVAEARIAKFTREPIVSVQWYAIWVQLACIIHLLYAVCTNSLAMHRFQLAVFLAVAEVFAVIGTNYIFSTVGSLIAVGVGWLLLAMIDLIWILYLTSEEGSPFYNLLNPNGTGGGGGFSNYSGVSNHRAASSGGYGNEPAVPRQNLNGGSMGVGTGIGSGMGGGQGNGGYGYIGGEIDGTPRKAPREEYGGGVEQPAGDVKPKAKAMYAYSADPSDPNEVSFNKGEILEVLDNTGKWFQVKTPSGQTGIAPSNYLSLL